MSPGVVAAIHVAGIRGEPLNILCILTLKLTF